MSNIERKLRELNRNTGLAGQVLTLADLRTAARLALEEAAEMLIHDESPDPRCNTWTSLCSLAASLGTGEG